MASQTKFWRKFNQTHFEKKIGLFSLAETPFGFFNEHDLFDLLVKHAQKKLEGRRPTALLRMSLDGKEIPINSDFEECLPKKADQSFIQYNKRMEELLGKIRYSLSVADLYVESAALYKDLLVAAEQMCRSVGRSQKRMDFQLFIGNYSRTLGGVHKDELCTFHIPLIGRKEMRFWPSQYAKLHPDLAGLRSYRKHVSNSVRTSTGVGEVLYWPSDYWHVAESKGDFSVTASMGWWTGDALRLQLNQDTEKILVKIGQDRDSDADFATKLRTEVSRRAQPSAEKLAVEFLKLKSSFSFWNPPVIVSGQPGSQAHLWPSRLFPVFLFETSASAGYLICNGRKLPVRLTAALRSLVRKIQSGRRVSNSHDSAKDENLQKALLFLYRNGGLGKAPR